MSGSVKLCQKLLLDSTLTSALLSVKVIDSV